MDGEHGRDQPGDTAATAALRRRTKLIEGHGHLEMQAVARRAAGLGRARLSPFRIEGRPDRRRGRGLLTNASIEAAFGGAKLLARNWADREKQRIGAYVAFHYDHPFAPLVIGPLSRAPEVLDVETAFTRRQLAGGARMLEAAQRDRIVPGDIDPHLTIALMIGGIRQALIGALMSERRPDPDRLTDRDLGLHGRGAAPARRISKPQRQRLRVEAEPEGSALNPNIGVHLVQPARFSRAAIVLQQAGPTAFEPKAAISGPATRNCRRRRC